MQQANAGKEGWETAFEKQVEKCRQGCRDLKSRLREDDSAERMQEVDEYCVLGIAANESLKAHRRNLLRDPGDEDTKRAVVRDLAQFQQACQKSRQTLNRNLSEDHDRADLKKRNQTWLTGEIMFYVFLFLAAAAFLAWKYLC